MNLTQKCSRCRTNKLLKFFKIRENTGQYYITCIKCSEKHKCNQCDYKCYKNGRLLMHIKSIHDKIKDIECELCNYKCSENGSLTKHIKAVHNKIKDYECKLCDYKSSRNSHVIRHIKAVHEKIKDFECNQCNSKFSTNCELKSHSKICTGKRNISSGEFQVIKSLSDLGFIEDDDYIFNKTHSSLADFCDRQLRFDFIFEEEKIVIEYDGLQHYEPVRFGGISQEQAEEQYKDTQITDKMKNDFCLENDYKMIRISYKDFGDVLGILSDGLFHVVNWVG